MLHVNMTHLMINKSFYIWTGSSDWFKTSLPFTSIGADCSDCSIDYFDLCFLGSYCMYLERSNHKWSALSSLVNRVIWVSETQYPLLNLLMTGMLGLYSTSPFCILMTLCVWPTTGAFRNLLKYSSLIQRSGINVHG